MSLCERCEKPLRAFTSHRRKHLNYDERKLHLKCWKEERNEYWIKQAFLKNVLN